jgi:hypothetical protein
MIISPCGGETPAELPADIIGALRATIDTDEAASWYLGQRRHDVRHLRYQNIPTRQ